MRLSALTFSLADRLPRLTGLLVQLWARSYSVWRRQEHWVFRQLRLRYHIRAERRVTLRSGHRLYVDPFDAIGRGIVASGFYEPETVEVFLAHLQPGMVFVDVGAHVGQYSILGSSRVGPNGEVHAFEPDPDTFRRLTRNILLNRSTNVRTNQLALADTEGDGLLYLSSVANVGGNSLQPFEGKSGAAGSTSVSITTLDRYVDAQRLSRIDLLKLDVEGAELLALRGGEHALSTCRPLILVEFSAFSMAFGYSVDELEHYLVSLGYMLYMISAPPLPLYVRSPVKPEWFNVFAVPQERVAELRKKNHIQ